jgi:V8-like Glu-specific endopeptidase
MNKRLGPSPRRFLLLKGAASFLAALLLAASICTGIAPVGAQNENQKLTELHHSGVKDCPGDIGQRSPSRVVLQYIDGIFHKWEEYDIGEKGEFCIFLKKPEQRRLLVDEAKTLLRNSERWREQAPPAGILEILDPADPRLQGRPVVRKLPDPLPIRKGPASTEPDRPAPPAYPGKKGYPRMDPDRGTPPRPEDVVGTDDRTRVTDTETYPWNTIGHIVNSYASGHSYRGTGAIIAPHMVLTAGHLVYDWSTEDGYAATIGFAPGQSQLSAGGAVIRPYGQFTASRWETNGNYIDALKTDPGIQFDHDYGAVFFDTSFADVGLHTYMPVVFAVAPPSIHLAGYPSSVRGETNSRAMWHSFGDVTGVTDRIIYYDADTTGGNSGGPVWESTSGPRRIVAVHVVSAPGGCRFVSQNQANIETWMMWKPASAGEGGGGCFIATAAYGSYLDPHVQTLQNFRNRYLLTNRLGRELVTLYYRYSPPLSGLIRNHESLRMITRVLLTPVVLAAEYPLGLPWACGLIAILYGGVNMTRRPVSSSQTFPLTLGRAVDPNPRPLG